MKKRISICIGGHLLKGVCASSFWQSVCLEFFRAQGETIERIADSRGNIVISSKRRLKSLFSRQLWECFSAADADDDLPDYLRWRASLSFDFVRGSIFLGVDSKASRSKIITEFFENEVLSRQSEVRYAYLFERERSKGPQSYVVGARADASWRAYAQPPDDLVWWWGNRLALEQDSEGIRDVYSKNYFLNREDNRFLERLENVAHGIGQSGKIGQYLSWRVDAPSDRAAARTALIECGIIAPPHWPNRAVEQETGPRGQE